MRRTKAVITAVAVGVLTFATACASSASTPVSVPPDSFASTTESAATAETANDAIYLSTDSIPEPTPHAPLSKPTAAPEPTPTQTPEPTEAPIPVPTDTPAPLTTSVWGDVVPATYGASYGTVSCSSVGINASLIWGDDQALLDSRSGVYQYAGSYQVGYGGCHLLCSHNDSTLALLQYVSIGDEFVVTTDYGQYVYTVDSARPGTVTADAGTVVADDGTILVDLSNTTDRLVMYTCYPFGYYQTTNQRYVVRATLSA